MMKAELKILPPNRVPGLERLEQTWQAMRISAQTQHRTVFAVSSLMALSALSHVPANLMWLSKATRSAARRTSGIAGGAIQGGCSEEAPALLISADAAVPAPSFLR